MRKGNSQSSPGAFNRLLWMVGIWGASVAALGVMAMAVRLAMSLAGMKP
ncbi:DUF2474 domain-containing protein [Pseudomonas sp. S32]|nr:DUF2474 domain-containing protein [Pseudomonas sp. S32]MBK5004573.1 DUF2474 domain-containing protein [Pseudomonas sp. S32]